jgi:hypothetical protein
MTAFAALLGVVGLAVAIAAWLLPRQPEAAPVTPSPSVPASTSTGPTASPVPRAEIARTPRLGLEFWQGDRSRMRVDRSSVETVVVAMRDEPFEIRLPRLPDDIGVMIGAWTDSSIHNLRDGLPVNDTDQFFPGSGMADSAFGSGRLNLSDDHHNNFTASRIAPYSQDLGSIYISTIAQRREQPGPTADVYLTIFIDRDNDDVVEFGEFEFLVLDYGG